MEGDPQGEEEAQPTLEDLKKDLRYTESDLRTKSNIIPILEGIDVSIQSVLENSWNGENQDFFLRVMLPKFVLTLLKRSSELAADGPQRATMFLKSVLDLVLETADRDIPELWQTAARILSLARKPFYHKHRAAFNDADMGDSDSDDDMDAEGVLLMECVSTESYPFAQNLEHFAKHKGFKAMLQHLHPTEQRKVNTLSMKYILKTFARVNDYLKDEAKEDVASEVEQLVFPHILGLADEELKGVNRKTIGDISHSMNLLLIAAGVRDVPMAINKFELAVARKFLLCPYLEKRLVGLNDIKHYLHQLTQKEEQAQRLHTPTSRFTSDPFAHLWIDSRFMCDWLDSMDIMEVLYVRTVHPDLIKRSGDIPKFLALKNALTNEHVDMMWGCAIGKHETIRHIIYRSLETDVCPNLAIEQVDHLFNKLTSIPFTQYDQPTMGLLQALTTRGLYINGTQIYGLELAWQAIQDETTCSTEIFNSAFDFLPMYLHWGPCHSHRMSFVQRCVDNIKAGKSVPYSMRLLKSIIESYPEKYDKSAHTSGGLQSSIIESLESHYGLVQLFFEDLNRFKVASGAALTALKAKNVAFEPHTVLVGKHSHSIQIQLRLEFMDCILSRSPLLLSTEQVNAFWSNVILNSLNIEERDSGYLWLQNIITREQSVRLETADFLLSEKIPALGAQSLGSKGFCFVDQLIRFVNAKHGRLDFTQTGEFIVHDFDIMGLDSVWRFALETNDLYVADYAAHFLISINKKLAPKIVNKTQEYRERFIATCMNYIKDAVEQLSSAGSIQKIQRCISLLKLYIEELEGGGQGHGAGASIKITLAMLSGPKEVIELSSKDTVGTLRQKAAEKLKLEPSSFRLITAGKELPNDNDLLAAFRIQDGNTVHVISRVKETPAGPSSARTHRLPPSPDKRLCPSTILSYQIYFEQLFQLLNLDANTAQMVWDLLMCLPTNSQLLQELGTFQSATRAAPDWNELLDTSSTFKLLYALQIVEAKVTPANDSERAESFAWCKGFEEKGGIHHLLHIFMTVNFFDEAKGSKRLICLALLLKIVNYFTLEFNAMDDSVLKFKDTSLLGSIGLENYINQLLDVSGKVAMSPVAEAELTATETPLGNAMKLLMQQLIACTVSIPVALSKLLAVSSLEAWMQSVLISSPHSHKRAAASAALFEICQRAAPSEASDDPFAFFLTKLLQFLPYTASQQTTDHYFDLLDKLIAHACTTAGSPAAFTGELIPLLVRLLKEHPVVETQDNVFSGFQDNVLIGILKVLRTLVATSAALKQQLGPQQGQGLVQEIFGSCLFDIPTIERHEADALPKCKSQEARTAAFNLLAELSRDCEDNFNELVDKLLAHHHGGEDRYLWKYLPSAYEKAMCGYVGLTNLGATCYMNSLMQQLYMIPGFRWSLLQVPSDTSTEKPEESTLYQLQLMMGGLQESARRYVETRPFCASYKGYDGEPINVGQQQDADEFMNMLFDKLENLLKGSPQEKMLQSILGGSLSNQFISRDCPHVSEREEGFYALSLDIKNKKNIMESLELYVQGDVLEGDNKYHCSQCNDKVDALKRCCISALPDNLIIHLKRFEFDLETMKRIKLNEHCVFPTLLDMEPYTKEGLARKEGRPVADLPPRPASYYQFELAGILVHSGTAEYGHYYSFAKERISRVQGQPLQWFQFNDTSVEPFDEQNIGKACYGGHDSVMEWDAIEGKQVQKWKPKPNNAYVLFYRRVEPIVDKIVEHYGKDAAAIVPAPIYQAIWETNTAFYQDKNIFDVTYFEFIWGFIMQHEQMPPVVDYDAGIDLEHPVMKSILLACNFLFETLSHAKEKGVLPQYIHQAKMLFSSHIPACKWFLEKEVENPLWLKELFLECSVPSTSEQYAKLVVHILGCMAQFERTKYNDKVNEVVPMDTDDEDSEEEQVVMRPVSLVVRFLETYCDIIDRGLERHWKQFAHYFMVLQDFAKLSDTERDLLLDWKLMYKLGNFYLGADSPFLGKRKKKKAIPMGDKKTAPKLEYMIGLFSVLVRGSQTDIPAEAPPPPTQLPGPALKLSGKDRKMITSEVFWKKVLSDGINPKECGDIACHLSWENEALTLQLIESITNGINESDAVRFPPFFEVCTALLTMQDSLQQYRVEIFLEQFLQVIMSNLKYRTATRDSIRYLVDMAPRIRCLRLWIHSHLAQFLEECLLAIPDYLVRAETENLVMALVPRANRKYIEEMKKLDKNFVEEPMTEEDFAMIQDIYTRLLQLLPATRRYKQGDIIHSKGKKSEEFPLAFYKLNGYFRLLDWCLRSSGQHQMFTKTFPDFINVFQMIEEDRYYCDENKKELFNYWCTAVEGSPENVRLITDNPNISNSLFGLLVSLNAGKENMVIFNEELLPKFYRLIYLCCQESSDFLSKWAMHNNFAWAINGMYVNSNAHPMSAEAIYKLCTLAATLPEFRKAQIVDTINGNALATNPANVLRYFDILLVSEKDSRLFAETRGFDQFSRFLYDHYYSALATRKDSDQLPSELLLLALRVLYRALQWTLVASSEKALVAAQQLFESWETKTIAEATLNIAERHKQQPEVTNAAYQFVEAVCRADTGFNTLDLVLQRQFTYMRDLMHVVSKESSVTDDSMNYAVKATVEICYLCHPSLKNEHASTLTDTALMAAIWFEFTKQPPTVDPYARLLALLIETCQAQYPIAEALRTSAYLRQYLDRVLIQNPANAFSGPSAQFVQCALPHAQALFDFTPTIQRVVTNAQYLGSRLTTQPEAITSLFHTIHALCLLLVKAAPEIRAAVAKMCEDISRQVAAVGAGPTTPEFTELVRLLGSLQPQ